MVDDTPVVPRHVGYIIDGNRRWAKKHGLPTYEGHLAGYNALKDVALATVEAGVEFMSVYSFSLENWKRDQEEVKNIMGLVMRLFTTDLKMFDELNVRLRVLGSRIHLTKSMIKAIEKAEAKTHDNTGGTLALCFNYSGQVEITDAVKSMIADKVKPAAITPETLEHYLYAPEVPPIDLIVRTSGEQRLSNFMVWRSVYSELLFLEKLWPEMTKDDVTAILKEYSKRQRRFGG